MGRIDERADPAGKLKLDNESLEAKLDDAEITVTKTERKLEKATASTKEQITEAKDKLKELHERDTKHYDKQIKSLNDDLSKLEKELSKVKASKTDKEIEEKRKQEIIDLKEEITKLNVEIKDLSSINVFKRLYRKLTNFYVTKEAKIEVIKAEKRVKEISNTYPKGHSFWDKYTSTIGSYDSPCTGGFGFINL